MKSQNKSYLFYLGIIILAIVNHFLISSSGDLKAIFVLFIAIFIGFYISLRKLSFNKEISISDAPQIAFNFKFTFTFIFWWIFIWDFFVLHIYDEYTRGFSPLEFSFSEYFQNHIFYDNSDYTFPIFFGITLFLIIVLNVVLWHLTDMTFKKIQKNN